MKNDSSEFAKYWRSATLGLILFLAAGIGAVVALNSAAGQAEPAVFLRPVLVVCTILGLTGIALNIQGAWHVQGIIDRVRSEEEERDAPPQ